MKFQGKVVVVTGAGSGMGRELALQLLQRGAQVAAVDVSPVGLQGTAAASGSSELATFTTDITDLAAVQALAGKVQERFGAVDGLINCAGIIQPFLRLNDLDLAAIERVFDVNFRGTLYTTKTFLPLLLQRPEAHIVNIASMGGFLPFPGQTAYGSSKAAVKLLTEGLYAELFETGVRVSVVLPGAIATDISKNSGVEIPSVAAQSPQYKPYPAIDAARDILDGAERNAYRVLVGRDAKLLDVLYRLAPARATLLIAKQMKNLLAKA